jgi:hypothetical protein
MVGTKERMGIWVKAYKLYYQQMTAQGRTPDEPEMHMDEHILKKLRSHTHSGAKTGIALIRHIEAELTKSSALTERWQDLLKQIRLKEIDEFAIIDFLARQARALEENGVRPTLWRDREAWKSRMRLTWDCIPQALASKLKASWDARINQPNTWDEFEELLLKKAREAETWLSEASSSSTSRNLTHYNPKAPATYYSDTEDTSYSRRGKEQSRKRKESHYGGARTSNVRPIRPKH